MDISEDRRADAVVLALSGKLDATTAKTFEDKILRLINSGAPRLVVDLALLEYVSSSGLRVFSRRQATTGHGRKDYLVWPARSRSAGVRPGRLLVYSFYLRFARRGR